MGAMRMEMRKKPVKREELKEEAKRAKTEEKRNHVEEVTSSDEDNVEEEHGKEEAKTEKTEETEASTGMHQTTTPQRLH